MVQLDLNLRKRPTFEEVANIIEKDAFKIDLPQRTYIRWEDTVARTQFDQFKEQTQEAELHRLRRQVAQAMPAPVARARRRGPAPTPGQATLTGEVTQGPEESEEVRRQRARFTVDNVTSLPSGGSDRRDPDAGSSASTVLPPYLRPLRTASSTASVPEDTSRGGGPDGRGGGSAGSAPKVSAHEVQTIMRQVSQENSIAHGKLQEALAHHTAAHAQTVQKQIEALAQGLAHESQRADARDAMSKSIAKSLEAVSKNQVATLPTSELTATQQNLDRMRAESVASASASSASQARQETLIGQIGNALGGVMQHVHGQNETIQGVMKALSEPRQTVLNQYGTHYVDQRSVVQDNRSVQQTTNVLNQDNRSLSVEQKILNLFQSGGQSSGSSSSGGGGPGGGPGGGGPPRPKSAPDQFYIGDAQPKQEKRVALAIEDRPKKQKPSQDVPIALPDRSRQAKRKPEIPNEAPEENVKKLGKLLVRAIRNNNKIRVAQPVKPPKIVDVGPATPFRGKGNRLGDEERPRVIKVHNKKATDTKRANARNQLAITA